MIPPMGKSEAQLQTNRFTNNITVIRHAHKRYNGCHFAKNTLRRLGVSTAGDILLSLDMTAIVLPLVLAAVQLTVLQTMHRVARPRQTI